MASQCPAPAGATAECIDGGLCGYTVDARSIASLTTSNGGVGGPDVFQVLTLADGNLYLGRHLINPVTGALTLIVGYLDNFQPASPNSVWVNSSGQTKFILAHRYFIQRVWPDAGVAMPYASGADGEFVYRPIAIDANAGLGFTNQTVFSLEDGGTVGSLMGCSTCGRGAMAIDANSIYTVIPSGGGVTAGMARFSRSGLGLHWQKTLAQAGKFSPPAISATGDVFALGEDGVVYGYHPDGSSVWGSFPTVPAIAYAPNCCSAGPLRFAVITTGGLLLVNASDNRVHAISLATGLEVWASAPLASLPQQMIVADNQVIYVQAADSVYGLDELSGKVRYRFENTPSPVFQGNAYPEYASMALKAGRLYVTGGLNLLSFPVPSMSMSRTSPWPRVFHDNQNTCHQQSELSY